MSLTTRRFADLTDVTLADEDTNSILTDNAIQGNVAVQMERRGVQILNQLVAQFSTDASGQNYKHCLRANILGPLCLWQCLIFI